MVRILAGLACVVVARAAGSSGEKASGGSSPLFTGGSAFDFVKSSVMLTADLSYFVVSDAGAAVWTYVPGEVRKQIVDQYSEVSGKVNTLRVQNGIPEPSAMWSDAKSEYYKKVDPLLIKVYDAAAKLTAVPFGFVKTRVAKFEDQYPEHAGKLSTGHIFDFVLIVYFLVNFVFAYFYRIFCFTVCCGFCAKRQDKKKAELVKPKQAVGKTNGSAKSNGARR